LGRREETDDGLGEDLVHSSLGEQRQIDSVEILLEESSLWEIGGEEG